MLALALPRKKAIERLQTGRRAGWYGLLLTKQRQYGRQEPHAHHQVAVYSGDGYALRLLLYFGRFRSAVWLILRFRTGVFYTTTRLRAAPEKLQRMKYDWMLKRVRLSLDCVTCPASPRALSECMSLSIQRVLFVEAKAR